MIIDVAYGLLLVGGIGFLWRALRGPSIADRLVAVDGLVAAVVAAVIVDAIDHGTPRFLDVAVVVALVGFLGTSAGARFIERRGA